MCERLAQKRDGKRDELRVWALFGVIFSGRRSALRPTRWMRVFFGRIFGFASVKSADGARPMAAPAPPLPDHPRIRSERWRLAGAPELHRLWVLPEGQARSWVVFLPGLGDAVERYADWFLWMADRGWGVLAADWPGHGRSGGPRGDIAGMRQCDDLIDACLDTLEARHGTGRRALWGHSMGGLMAIRQLGRSPMEWRWTWLSSPLLSPAARTPAWKRQFAPAIARLAPQLPMDTGVRPEHCQHGDTRAKFTAPESFWHHVVSARFGRALLDEEKRLALISKRIRRDMPLLLTQGEEDPICPLPLARAWAEDLMERGSQIRLATIADGLHEPLLDPAHADQVQQIAADWFETQVANPAAANAE